MKLTDIKPQKEWSTGQLQDLAESLERDFMAGSIIRETKQGAIRVSLEHAVGTSGKLKFEVFSNEHAPPHFRVSYDGESANFAIKDCAKLNGGLNQYEKTIQLWHRDNKQEIINKWNSTRPTNCPVGPYTE